MEWCLSCPIRIVNYLDSPEMSRKPNRTFVMEHGARDLLNRQKEVVRKRMKEVGVMHIDGDPDVKKLLKSNTSRKQFPCSGWMPLEVFHTAYIMYGHMSFFFVV